MHGSRREGPFGADWLPHFRQSTSGDVVKCVSYQHQCDCGVNNTFNVSASSARKALYDYNPLLSKKVIKLEYSKRLPFPESKK